MRFPRTCKLAVHSSGITSLGAMWAISVCGYCSHHRVTSEMWVRSWHRLPACWVISLCWTCGMCCFASTPQPLPALPPVIGRFFLQVFCCVYLYLLMVGAKRCWCRAKHTEACCILTWIILLILIFFQLLLLVFRSAPQGRGLRSVCFVLRCLAVCQGIRLLRLYTGRQRWKLRRGTGREARRSDSINQGDSGRCRSNWLPASWTQCIMHLGWGWRFNGLISLTRIVLLCVFDYMKYCVKLLHWDELILPSCVEYSLHCLSRILPVSCWNPLK